MAPAIGWIRLYAAWALEVVSFRRLSMMSGTRHDRGGTRAEPVSERPLPVTGEVA